MLNIADFVPGRDLFLLLITAFQTLVKRTGGGSGGSKSISLSSTSIGSSVFLSSPLLTLSADIGSAGVTSADGDGDSDGDSDGDGDGNGDDNGDGDGDGDGNSDGTSIIFCLFFATFAFLFAFFLGGCKIAEAGID